MFDQKVNNTPSSVCAIVSSPIPISIASAERRSPEWKKYGLNSRQLSGSTRPRLGIALLSQPVAARMLYQTRPKSQSTGWAGFRIQLSETIIHKGLQRYFLLPHEPGLWEAPGGQQVEHGADAARGGQLYRAARTPCDRSVLDTA